MKLSERKLIEREYWRQQYWKQHMTLECQGCGDPIFVDHVRGHELCQQCGLGKNCCCDCDEGEGSEEKQCTTCGHVGTDVIDRAWHTSSQVHWAVQCANLPLCWERWERNGDFWERQQTTLLASQGQYNVP